MHLASVGVSEASQFQIEEDETSEAAVEENQVHTIPFVINAQPALPTHKSEVVAQFQQEGFKMAD